MSNFNPLDRAKIPTHRSSFDLSSKKLFTAKVGEILPCYWQIAIPDTKYRISDLENTLPLHPSGRAKPKARTADPGSVLLLGSRKVSGDRCLING